MTFKELLIFDMNNLIKTQIQKNIKSRVLFCADLLIHTLTYKSDFIESLIEIEGKIDLSYYISYTNHYIAL